MYLFSQISGWQNNDCALNFNQLLMLKGSLSPFIDYYDKNQMTAKFILLIWGPLYKSTN